MKRLTAFALPALSLLALTAGCAPLHAPIQAEDAGPWQVILQMDVQHPTIAARFLDGTFGITVGDSGQLTHTADGGRAWVQVSDDDAQSRAGLDIVDGDVAWLAGAGGRVWVSADGARNWRTVSRLPYRGHVEFISFLDGRTGGRSLSNSPGRWSVVRRERWRASSVARRMEFAV